MGLESWPWWQKVSLQCTSRSFGVRLPRQRRHRQQISLDFGRCELAKVSGIVTSSVINLPYCHGISVNPSTHLSLPPRVELLGSFWGDLLYQESVVNDVVDGKMSWYLARNSGGIISLWLPIRPTLAPQGQPCSSQRSIPRHPNIEGTVKAGVR